jgi:hypothetical protein
MPALVNLERMAMIVAALLTGAAQVVHNECRNTSISPSRS